MRSSAPQTALVVAIASLASAVVAGLVYVGILFAMRVVPEEIRHALTPAGRRA